MKSRFKLLLILSILAVITTACSPSLVRRSTPKPDSQIPVIEAFELAPFTKIDIEAAGPIILIQGNTHAIQIEGLQNVVKDITFEVRDGVLVIKHSNTIWDWITERDFPTITITFKNLTHFNQQGGSELVANNLQSESLSMVMRGGASVNILDLNVDTFMLQVEGGAHINISGIAASQTASFQGGSNYDAEELRSDSVRLKIEGAVSATVWATELLDLDLNGAYDVKYYGSPSLTQSIKGVGSVESMGDK